MLGKVERLSLNNKTNTPIKKKFKDIRLLQRFAVYGFAFGVFIFSIFPFWWMLISSFKTDDELFSKIPTIFPHNITLANYMKLMDNASFWNAFLNSIIVAGVVTVAGIILAVLAAYAIARFRIRGKSALMVLILSVQMFPPVVMIIPLFIVMTNLHLTDTLFSLIITYMTFSLPLAIWMLRGFFAAIPVELEEAAMIDGCSQMQAFRKVILPLVLPGIAATSIYGFLNAWNEFMFALTFIKSDSLQTLPVALQQFFEKYTADYSGLMAATTIATIPVLIFFIFVQKNLAKGLTQGAVKE